MLHKFTLSVKLKTNSTTVHEHFGYYVMSKRGPRTFGLVMLLGRPPADAGLVLVQVKEPDQSFLLALQLGHLSAGLHGAHTPLHFVTQKDTLCVPLIRNPA